RRKARRAGRARRPTLPARLLAAQPSGAPPGGVGRAPSSRHAKEERVDVAAIRSQIPDGIRAQFGEPRGVEHLGGLSGAAVLRLNFGTCTAILKQGAPAVELHVYGRLDELFRAHNVHMPRLLASGDAGGSPWLLIEDVP